MAVRYTATQLRELKAVRDRELADEAIEDICEDIGDKVIEVAKDGKTKIIFILSGSETIVNLGFGGRFAAFIPYKSYNAILDKYLVDGCADGLRRAFPECLVGTEEMEGSWAITVDWTGGGAAAGAGAATGEN